uniref:Uncharacterized protein n=1 Tax=Xiphophorus couchianus TaxID=32473 RepID=A0A3B5M251_9TELE
RSCAAAGAASLSLLPAGAARRWRSCSPQRRRRSCGSAGAPGGSSAADRASLAPPVAGRGSACPASARPLYLRKPEKLRN